MRTRSSAAIVVITRNEGLELRRTVDNLLDTAPLGSDLIVIDDASTDDSTEFLSGYNAVQTERLAAPLGIARARNLGASMTEAPYVIFSDAHVRVQSSCIAALCEQLANPEVGVVAPAIEDLENPGFRGYGRVSKESFVSQRVRQ